MTTKTKIIIVVLLIASIAIVVFGVHKSKTKEEKNVTRQRDFSDVVEYYTSDSEENRDNSILNDTNLISSNTVTNTSNTTNTTVVGKEEQESASQNSGANDEQTAIQLAQKEWGLSVSAYDFKATKNDDGTYNVEVINKTNTRTEVEYIVNVRTGSVVEK